MNTINDRPVESRGALRAGVALRARGVLDFVPIRKRSGGA